MPTAFETLLERFAAAVAANDPDALADCFTADGTYDDYFFGPRSGRGGIRETLRHFYEGGEDFRWEFHDALSDGRRGYARYRFSYTSKHPAADGGRVLFDGISHFELEDGLIKSYCEAFDRGMALAQQDYDGARLRNIGLRYAEALRSRPEWSDHLTRPEES